MKKEEWKQRRDIKDTVGVDALRKTINEYEEKMCKLHTENLNLKHEIKQLEENLRIKTQNADNFWQYFKKEEDKLKRLRESINFVEDAMKMSWFEKYLNLKRLERTVQVMIRGW